MHLSRHGDRRNLGVTFGNYDFAIALESTFDGIVYEPISGGMLAYMSIAVLPSDRDLFWSDREVGQKALVLHELQKLVSVPKFYSIRAEHLESAFGLSESRRKYPIEELKERCAVWQDKVQEVVLKRSWVATEIRDRLLANLGTELMIRSSGVGEGSDKASFSGIYESVFSKNDGVEVLKRLCEVYRSRFSSRCLAYLERNGTGASEIALPQMSIFIQEYIKGSRGGVLFTRSPFRGEGGWLEIGSSAAEIVQGYEPICSVCIASEGTVDIGAISLAFPSSLEAGGFAQQLGGAVSASKQVLGGDAEIEWAWHQNSLWVLQAKRVRSGRGL